MALYYFNLIGVDIDDVGAHYESKSAARNAAVVCLSEYLRDYPEYANQGHWQVDVLDADRDLVLSVVVATVDAAAVQALGKKTVRDHAGATDGRTAANGNGRHV